MKVTAGRLTAVPRPARRLLRTLLVGLLVASTASAADGGIIDVERAALQTPDGGTVDVTGGAWLSTAQLLETARELADKRAQVETYEAGPPLLSPVALVINVVVGLVCFAAGAYVGWQLSHLK